MKYYLSKPATTYRIFPHDSLGLLVLGLGLWRGNEIIIRLPVIVERPLLRSHSKPFHQATHHETLESLKTTSRTSDSSITLQIRRRNTLTEQKGSEIKLSKRGVWRLPLEFRNGGEKPRRRRRGGTRVLTSLVSVNSHQGQEHGNLVGPESDLALVASMSSSKQGTLSNHSQARRRR
ncbi:hypothetical protein DsansV1_C21g0167371 [Dioscorea sansibarensis]